MNFTPSVSVVLSVYNEERSIEQKILNLLELNYPKDKLDIIIGSDGSNDKTNIIAQKYLSGRISFLKWNEQRGKINVLNDLIKSAKGDIVVFTDARQIFDKDAVRELMDNFADESVGCVSGELVLLDDNQSSIGHGVGFYWKYEILLRQKESQIGSMLGATGAIYAIRKNLYQAPPPETLLDDVYIPFKIIEQGYRAVFEPKALAYDKVSDDSQQEFKRKVRTIAGNCQLFINFRKFFNPFLSSITFQLISHKLLRVIAPFFLIVIFILNLFLLNAQFYKILFVLQIVFYLLASVGLIYKRWLVGVFQIPYTFMVLNLAAVKGLYLFIRNKQSVLWKK